MDKRQSYALAHPLERADNDDPRELRPYMKDRPHPVGVTIRTILAVDR